MDTELIQKEYGTEAAVEGLERLIRVICTSKVIVEHELTDEVYLLYVLRDAIRKG